MLLADCLTKIQSTPNSIHLSMLGLEIKSNLNLFKLGRKDPAEEVYRRGKKSLFSKKSTLMFRQFCCCFPNCCFCSLSELTRRIHAVLAQVRTSHQSIDLHFNETVYTFGMERHGLQGFVALVFAMVFDAPRNGGRSGLRTNNLCETHQDQVLYACARRLAS